MAWKGLHLTRAARLSLADRQLAVRSETGEIRVALEDLGWIVIDTPAITLTSALIAACMEAGIAIVTTDQRHTPSGLLLPFHRHYRQAGVGHTQISVGVPLRKRIWQRLVQTKILNQAKHLEQRRGQAAPLPEMARLVASGDPDNVEARAAREYWSMLFRDFARGDESDFRNHLLDYGYAVIRACIARSCVAAGLLPCFGLHHSSISNAFNLVDDLIEPFRPFVDHAAFALSGGETEKDRQLSTEDRQSLAGIPLRTAWIGKETMTLFAASEAVAESLVRALESNDAFALQLPTWAKDL